MSGPLYFLGRYYVFRHVLARLASCVFIPAMLVNAVRRGFPAGLFDMLVTAT